MRRVPLRIGSGRLMHPCPIWQHPSFPATSLRDVQRVPRCRVAGWVGWVSGSGIGRMHPNLGLHVACRSSRRTLTHNRDLIEHHRSPAMGVRVGVRPRSDVGPRRGRRRLGEGGHGPRGEARGSPRGYRGRALRRAPFAGCSLPSNHNGGSWLVVSMLKTDGARICGRGPPPRPFATRAPWCGGKASWLVRRSRRFPMGGTQHQAGQHVLSRDDSPCGRTPRGAPHREA